MTRVRWTSKMWLRAQEMCRAGMDELEIAIDLGLPQASIRYKFENERFVGRTTLMPRRPAAKTSIRIATSPQGRPPQHVEEERERRLAARDRQDLTASFFGDPPPGYSALDQREDRP